MLLHLLIKIIHRSAQIDDLLLMDYLGAASVALGTHLGGATINKSGIIPSISVERQVLNLIFAGRKGCFRFTNLRCIALFQDVHPCAGATIVVICRVVPSLPNFFLCKTDPAGVVNVDVFLFFVLDYT